MRMTLKEKQKMREEQEKQDKLFSELFLPRSKYMAYNLKQLQKFIESGVAYEKIMLHFGKHSKKILSNVPQSYLTWIKNTKC